MADRARVRMLDYREITLAGGPGFDAIVSVGMFEHVGAAKLPDYFAQAWGLLKPRGVFLNHGIAARANVQPVHGPGFIDTYVFPDAELTPVSTTLCAAEAARLEVRDLESLREHYVLTLRHWVRRLEAQYARALRYVDEPTYRVWRLYMAASAHRFSAGLLNINQTLFVKPDDQGHSGLPLTRADWYAPRECLDQRGLPSAAGAPADAVCNS